MAEGMENIEKVEEAEAQAKQIVERAKTRSKEIIDEANARAQTIVSEAETGAAEAKKQKLEQSRKRLEELHAQRLEEANREGRMLRNTKASKQLLRRIARVVAEMLTGV